jgi:hypothetical protein
MVVCEAYAIIREGTVEKLAGIKNGSLVKLIREQV